MKEAPKVRARSRGTTTRKAVALKLLLMPTAGSAVLGTVVRADGSAVMGTVVGVGEDLGLTTIEGMGVGLSELVDGDSVVTAWPGVGEAVTRLVLEFTQPLAAQRQ